MAEVTRGGWADKLRDMPTGPLPEPEPWRAGDLATAVPLSPIDSVMRMLSRGQAGILTPRQRDALRGAVRDYVPDGAVNAFERGIDAAGHLSAAIPYGTFVRAGQAPVAARNAPVLIPESVLARNGLERQAEMQARLDALDAAKRAANPATEVQIVPRQSAQSPAPPPPRPAIASEPPIPMRQQPPPSMAGQGSPTGYATGADNPPSLPGSPSPSLAPVPPPPISSEARAAAYREVAARALNSPVFGAPMSPEIMRNMVAEVSRKYGVPFRDVINSLGEVQINTPPRPSIVAKEPPPLNAFEAAGGKAQLRLPFPTSNDMRMRFWDDLQAVLNHGGKIGDVDPTAASNASGLSPRMVADRLKRAGRTGIDGQELADLIRRSIESGNWKLAVPPIAAGMIGPDEYRGQ